MHIEAVPWVRHRICPAVPDKPGQYSDNALIRNAVFPAAAIISTEHIVLFSHLDDPVKYILPTVPLIKRHIIFFQSALGAFYDEQIPAFSEQWHHTVPDIGIDQSPMLF